jgi:hypothetical protein
LETYKDLGCIPSRFTGVGYFIVYAAKVWFKNGMFHREDGPAMVYDNGEQRWFVNNIYHRLDGPARIIPPNARGNPQEHVEYWINNRYLKKGTETNYWNHPLVIEHKLNKIISHATI